MPGGLQIDAKPWTPEEDHVILDMHAVDGPKWSTIVQALPGRTISSVRNRWQRLEKGRKLREAGLESRNRCHACGKAKRGHICYAKAQGGPQVDIKNPIQPYMPYPPALSAPTFHGPGPIRHGRRHGTRASEASQAEKALFETYDFETALEPSEEEMSNSSVASPVTVSAEPPPALTVDLGLVPPLAPAVHKRRVSFADNNNVSFSDTAAPAAALVPALERSNTSFFNTLVDSGVFTPSSTAFIEPWAAPSDALEPPGLLKENSSSQLAPPPLLKDMSLSQLVPPMPTLQRSFDSFTYASWMTPSPAPVRLAA